METTQLEHARQPSTEITARPRLRSGPPARADGVLGGRPRRLRRRPPVVIAASPSDATRIAKLALARGLHVVTRVDEALLTQDLELAVLEGAFDLVVHDSMFDAVREQAPWLLTCAHEVRPVGRFQDDATGLSVEVLDPWDLPIRPAWAAVRRALDVVAGSLGLVLVSPILFAGAAAVWLETPGSPMFHQERVGWNGRRFTLHKLRTMESGASDAEHREYIASLVQGEAVPVDGVFKLVHDPRITRVGAVLRRFSIDELPQLWNVVRGDMSLIGPRPDLLSTLVQCPGVVWARNRVRPGLTGLWQVNGRSRIPFAAMIALDLRYCEEVSPAVDLSILLRTPPVVLRGTGSA